MSHPTGSVDGRAIGVPVTVGPLEAVARAGRGAFRITGRASRSEFWWFQLVYAVVLAVTFGVDTLLDLGGVILLGVLVVTLPMAIPLCVRRLHDASYSGAWFFVQFLPFVGLFWILVLLVQPSKRLSNAFGPGPDDLQPR